MSVRPTTVVVNSVALTTTEATSVVATLDTALATTMLRVRILMSVLKTPNVHTRVQTHWAVTNVLVVMVTNFTMTTIHVLTLMNVL